MYNNIHRCLLTSLLIKGQIISNFEMVFGVFDFLQKTNKRIRLYYYDTSSRLVLVRFLEESADIKKLF